MTDERLIELYFARDEEALRLTAESYGKYLGTVAYPILSDVGQSDECVNDTYYRAWHSIPPTRPNILRSFLARITRNLALDRYKARRAEKRGGGVMAESLDELAECVGEPSNEDSALIAEIINRMLKDSRPRDRRIFVKRYFYQRSIEQICEEMELGASLVKVTLHRMRQSLKEMLKEAEVYL